MKKEILADVLMKKKFSWYGEEVVLGGGIYLGQYFFAVRARRTGMWTPGLVGKGALGTWTQNYVPRCALWSFLRGVVPGLPSTVFIYIRSNIDFTRLAPGGRMQNS